jgi:tetratricopeptide (TPR) repeat protein
MPQPASAIKVFYSYSHKDEELREQLEAHLSLLRRQGIIESWHDRSISEGSKWAGEIDESLKTADLILPLVSADFLSSDYCYGVEMRQAMKRHEKGEALVIPVILRPCDWKSTPFGKLQALPTNARPITQWGDRDEAFSDVAEGIRRVVDQVIKKRHPPRSSTSQFRTAEAPFLSHIPRPPVIGFVARRDAEGRDIVERLRDELTPQKSQLVVLWGAGGVGKTTLAAEAVRSLMNVFGSRVVWTSANGRADYSFSTMLDDIATQLDRTDLRPLTPEQKSEQLRTVLAEAPALVVLDNFETVATAEQTCSVEFLLNRAPCPVLITTRERIPQARSIQIAAMSVEEAHEYLLRLIEQTGDPSVFARLDHERILAASERNPLVLQWVVAQIDLAQEPDAVLDDLMQGEGDAAQHVFDRSFNLPQLMDDGRAALLALSLFAPSASRPALAFVAGFSDDEKRLNEAVKRLATLWLVKSVAEGKRLAVEGLTRGLAKARLSRDKHADEYRQRFVAHFLSYAGAHEQPTPEDLDALDAEKDNLLGAMDAAIEIENWQKVMLIYSAIGYFLDLRGYWDEAIRRGQQAIESARAANDELAVAGFSGNIARILMSRGEYNEAQQLLEHVLATYKRLRVEEGISSALHNLGFIAQAQSNFMLAEQFYRESLAIEERLNNPRGIAVTLHNLAMLAQAQGELSEARQLYDRSLGLEQRIGNIRGVATSLHQLAMLAQAQGDTAEAERLYLESLEIKKQLGDQSGIANTLNQLGTIAETRGELVEAQRLYAESLEIAKKLGDYRTTASTLHNLGVIAQRQGDLIEAQRLYNESLSLKNRLGDRRGEATTLHNLAAVAEMQGDLAQARRFYEQAIEIEEGLGDPRIADSSSGLAAIVQAQLEAEHQRAEQLMDVGRWRDARDILEKNKEEYRKINYRLGFARTLLALAQAEHATGDLERARWTYKDALDQFRELDERYAAVASVYLGRLELQTGLVKDAMTHLKDAESYFIKVGNKDNLAVVRQLVEAAEQLASEQLDDEKWAGKLFTRRKPKAKK